MWNFPNMSNEIAKSCQGSLFHGQGMKQAPVPTQQRERMVADLML